LSIHMIVLKTIGVVGGMGPDAGIDLAQKITQETIASRDQDHLPMILISSPHLIEDRTKYLDNPNLENPGRSIAKIVVQLAQAGADVVGIPCNTAHSPMIWNEMKKNLDQRKINIPILHLVQETATYFSSFKPAVSKVGLLSTLGTYQSEIYPSTLKRFGMDVIEPEADEKDKIHAAIYDLNYGIKAKPVTERARNTLLDISHHLVEKGAQAIIMGCTEIPLALDQSDCEPIPLIDPTRILARALIREACPEKLCSL